MIGYLEDQQPAGVTHRPEHNLREDESPYASVAEARLFMVCRQATHVLCLSFVDDGNPSISVSFLVLRRCCFAALWL